MTHALVTTLLGITLPFVVYTSLTSAVAFLIGPLGGGLLLGGVGWKHLVGARLKYNRRMLAYVVLVGGLGKHRY